MSFRGKERNPENKQYRIRTTLDSNTIFLCLDILCWLSGDYQNIRNNTDIIADVISNLYADQEIDEDEFQDAIDDLMRIEEEMLAYP